MRVLVTDGLDAASDASDGVFRVAAKAPRAIILSPQPDAMLGSEGKLILDGTASDPEEGPLPDASLSWSSDVAGPLGAGATVLLDGLACGDQTITLAATDSSGAVGSASVHVRSCCVSIEPETVHLPREGGTVTIEVHCTGGACPWEASGRAGWTTITSGTPGAGDGTVTFSVAPNPALTGRRTSLTVAGREVTVSQDGYRPRVRTRLH